MSEFEERLKRHAELTKSVMHSPFDTERKEFVMIKKTRSIKKIAVLAAVVLCLVGTSGFAAYRLLSAREAATALGDCKLAKYFEKRGSVSETVTDGDYRATVLGITSGEGLSSFKSSSWEIFSERTYAVVSVERADGTPMTYDDEILVTPLIQGLKPWQFNIFTMNGGYTADIINGVLYRIIEFDSIEYFSDRDVYMAILSAPFLNNEAYAYNEASGKISPKQAFDGTNILIKLKLDPSNADPEKAEEYLAELNETVKTDAIDQADTDYASGDGEIESEEIEIHNFADFNIETKEDGGSVSVTITDK